MVLRVEAGTPEALAAGVGNDGNLDLHQDIGDAAGTAQLTPAGDEAGLRHAADASVHTTRHDVCVSIQRDSAHTDNLHACHVIEGVSPCHLSTVVARHWAMSDRFEGIIGLLLFCRDFFGGKRNKVA